jgi:hypothetical protein
MSYPVISACPVCNHELYVKKLACSNCHTTIENDFTLTKFSALTAEQMHFAEVFLISRGNIKEVEKVLGISYPTVRGKLNEIITLLHRGEPQKQDAAPSQSKTKIISMLENGDISTEEAVQLLKNSEGGEE